MSCERIYKKLFLFSIAQRESVVEPYGMTDHGFGETMVFISCSSSDLI